MRKIIERVMVFVIGVPVFFIAIFLLPHYKNLAFNILVVLFSAVGGMEVSDLLKKKNIVISKIEAFILGALAPVAAVLTVCFNMPAIIIELLLITGAIWIVLSLAFTKKDSMDTVASRLIGRLSLILYPGFFMYWIVKISIWENPFAIFLFLIIVFINDSAAWLFGSLFGKNNKGLVPASPNKSIAGFIGGTVCAVLISLLAAVFFPNRFPAFEESALFIPFIPTVLIISFFTGIFATLGDLAESALKRSCEVSDSGQIMLGRGGILDSIDSIALAAPVFYLLYSYLFCL